MFGLFKKPHATAASTEEVTLMVRAVKGSIGPQLILAARNERELLHTKFGLGYLMGVCDAIAQKRGIPQVEDLGVIGAAFAALFPLHPPAFAAAIALSEDPEFIEGQNMGGSEMYALLSAGQSVPMGLYDYWKRQLKLNGISHVH